MAESSIRVPDDDIRTLQGAWRQTASEANGIADPADEFGPAPRLVCSGNRFTVTRADGELVIAGTFVLDQTRTPATVDWTDTVGADAGQTFPAIYRLEGDLFTFCAADHGAPRPARFDTRPGSGHVLRVHRRETRGETHEFDSTP